MSKEDNRFYVYLHRRGDTNEVFYVGKGSGNRSHSVRGRSNWWEKVYHKHGRTVEYVEKGLSEQDAFDLEAEAIKFYRECNHPLCNLTDGGEGVSGYKPTQEAIARAAAKVSKEVLCSNGMLFKSCREAAIWLGKPTSDSQISRCCRREKLSSAGYVWRYTTDCEDLMESLNKGEDFYVAQSKRVVQRLSSRKAVYCSNGMVFNGLVEASVWLSNTLGITVKASNVAKCCRGDRKTARGYKFSYEDIFGLDTAA